MDGWKHGVANYRQAALYLLQNMQANGFDAESPIPIDPDGELLNGSHRVACASALGIKEITVARQSTKAWAPPWDLQWFHDNNMPYPDIKQIEKDLEEMASG